MIRITLKNKGKVLNLPETISIKNRALVSELVEEVARITGLNAVRVRLTVKVDPSLQNNEDIAGATRAKDYVLQSDDKLANFTAGSSDITIYVRDLGPQLAWRTVFLLEYLGPLIIQPLFYYGQKYVYGSEEPHSFVQKCVFAAIMAHYIKRELETAFLHRFSLATMPLFNLFKNCGHYWLLSGFVLGYFTFAPASWAEGNTVVGKILYANNLFGWTDGQVKVVFSAWVLAELFNFFAHLTLASLRPSGTAVRKIPYGFGFQLVSCPNYLWESLGWLLITVVTGNWAVGVFFVVGFVQMYFWAIKKHRRYLREFPDYPKNRKAMIPFLS